MKDPEYISNQNRIKDLELRKEEKPESPIGFKDIQNKKALINAELDSLNRKMYSLEVRKNKLARKEEINNEQVQLGKKSAELDRKLNLLGEFEQDKVIEDLVSQHFELVRFRFFEFTLEGNVNPTCEILLNGVPFKDLNTAGKLNAGLDIIKTLSRHFGIKAPVFLDNRESVTEILPIDTQVINLFVSPLHKTLKIEN